MDELATKDKDVQSDKKDRFDVYLEKIYGPTVPDEFYLDKNLTAMGRKAHELYLEARKKEGSSKADEWPVWDKLSPADKELNKEQARYIPEQLDSLGYCICYARSDSAEAEITPEDKEIMARAEHDRWMGNKFSQGRTRPRFEGDVEFPHHKDLIDWKNLKPEEKKKDYEVIESYPVLLAQCKPAMKICRRQGGFRNSYEAWGAATIPLIVSTSGYADAVDGESIDFYKKRLAGFFQICRDKMPHTDLVLMTGLMGEMDFVSVDVAHECKVRIAPVIPCELAEHRKKFGEDRFAEVLRKCTYEPYDISKEHGGSSEGLEASKMVSAYLITHSHILVAGWNGYKDDSCWVYDTVKMACCGLDFDFIPKNVDHIIETMEDMPVYWIRVGSGAGTEVMDRGQSSGFLVPFLVQDDVENIQNDSKRRFKNLPKLRKMEPKVKDASLSNEKKIKNGFIKEMPEYYNQIFGRIDKFNADIGAVEDKSVLIHRCSEDSILDKAYSYGAKGDNSTWILDRNILNYRYPGECTYARDSENAVKEEQSTARTIETVHRMRMADATAMRFYALSTMTKDLKSKSHIVFFISSVITVMATFLLSFFMLTGTSLLILAAYVIAVFLGQTLLWFHMKRDTFNRFVESRCLAKYLRVRYNLSLLGIEDALPMTFYDHKRNDTFWVRAAMMAWNSHFMNDRCNIDKKVPDVDMLAFVKYSWIMEERRRNSVFLASCERVRATGAVLTTLFYGLILLASVLVIFGSMGLFGNAVIFGMEGIDAGGMEMISDMEFDSLTFIKVLLMIIVAVFAGVSMLRDHYISSTPEQMMAEERMYDISLGRIESLARDSSNGSYDQGDVEKLKRIYRELGHQCVRENCEWVLKVKGLNIRNIGFGNVRAFYKFRGAQSR